MLQLAEIIAHILSKECTSCKMVRRKFMQQLAEELRAAFMEEKKGRGTRSEQRCAPQQMPKWRQCQVRL